MAFTFVPDDGPARIFRFVESGTLPSLKLLCVLDAKQNLLIIDREKFFKLNKVQQNAVKRTHALSITLEEGQPVELAA
jgi:hypothetical protein